MYPCVYIFGIYESTLIETAEAGLTTSHVTSRTWENIQTYIYKYIYTCIKQESPEVTLQFVSLSLPPSFSVANRQNLRNDRAVTISTSFTPFPRSSSHYYNTTNEEIKEIYIPDWKKRREKKGKKGIDKKKH